MCKPNKMNGAARLKLAVQKVGFGRVRTEACAADDLRERDGALLSPNGSASNRIAADAVADHSDRHDQLDQFLEQE